MDSCFIFLKSRKSDQKSGLLDGVVLATFNVFSIIVTLKLRCLSKGTSSRGSTSGHSKREPPYISATGFYFNVFLLVSFVFLFFFLLLRIFFLLSLGLKKTE